MDNNFLVNILLFKFRKIITFVAVLSGILLPGLNSYAYEINISADNLEYSEDREGRLSAKGNVTLDWEGRKIYADCVEFILNEKIISAYGNVKIKESKNIIYADSIKYSYDKKDDGMKGIFGYFEGVFIRAESIEKSSKDTNNDVYDISDIKVSKCDLDDPHLYFQAKRGKLLLNKRVIIYNVIPHINKIPVFWLPIFYKTLDKESFLYKLKVEFTPYFLRGWKPSLKTQLSYPLNKYWTGKLIFDPGKFNFGGTLSYTAENARGNLSAFYGRLLYGFSPGYKDKEGFHVVFNYFQKINYILGMIWELRTSGLIYFGDSKLIGSKRTHIFLSGRKDDINLIMGLTLPRVKTNRGVGYNNWERLIPFMSPEIDFTYYPKSIFWGITSKFNFYGTLYRGRWYKDDEKIVDRMVACLNWAVTKNFSFLKRFALKPTLEIFGNGNINTFIVGGKGSLNLRFRVTEWMDWDANYCLGLKNREESFSNEFSFVNYMYFGDKITVRNFFLYDRRHEALTPKETLKLVMGAGSSAMGTGKLTPTGTSEATYGNGQSFVTEMTCTPVNFITAYIKFPLLLNPLKFDYFQIYSRIGELDKFYFNFNFFCNSREIDNIFGLGSWITPKWRLDFNLTTQYSLNSRDIGIKGCEFKVYRNLHCYNIGLVFRSAKDPSGDFMPEILFQWDSNKSFKKKEYFNAFENMPVSWLY